MLDWILQNWKDLGIVAIFIFLLQQTISYWIHKNLKVHYSKIYERKFEMIIDIFGNVVEFETLLNTMQQMFNKKDVEGAKKYIKEFQDLGNEYNDLSTKVEIFFTEKEKEIIILLLDLRKEIRMLYYYYALDNGNDGSKDAIDYSVKQWEKKTKAINETIPNLKEVLMKKFQKSLGIK